MAIAVRRVGVFATAAAAAQFATAMQPALQSLWQQAALPAWLALAMALHESGAPPAADSTFVLQTNPWGVRCFQGQYACSATDFQVYPSLTAAATSLVAALGPIRLQLVADPTAFMQELQDSGWDGPAPGNAGYAASVLYTWGPVAKAALAAVGADLNTGVGTGGSGVGGGGGSVGFQPIAATLAAAPTWAIGVGGAVAVVGAAAALHPLRRTEGRPLV